MLHSICQQIWKTQQWPQDWKRSVFILIPKKGNTKCQMFKLPYNCTHFTCQQSCSNPSSQACTVCEPRTSRFTNLIQKRQRNQKSNCRHHWIIEKARKFRKNFYSFFIDYMETFDCVDHNKLWKILRDGNTRPSYLSSEKLVCGSRSNSQNKKWSNRLVQNWERSTSRLYTVTLLI